LNTQALIFFGEKSLRWAINEYVEHFHRERSRSATEGDQSQGLGNRIPFPQNPQSGSTEGLIVESERLGDLLNYYYRD
jgi:hypothetical protein